MNEKMYLHTINNMYSDYYLPKRQKEIFERILQSGEVLSRRLQGNNSEITNFSGLDYISLTDYEKRYVSNKQASHYNSYYAYVLSGLSLCFPHDKLEVIEPTIIRVCSKNRRDFEIMRELGMCEEERFTDLPDEVQVKDRIPLSLMNGVLFPVENYMCSKAFIKRTRLLERMKKELETIKNMLDHYGYNVGVYDTITLTELNDENINRLVLNKIDKHY